MEKWNHQLHRTRFCQCQASSAVLGIVHHNHSLPLLVILQETVQTLQFHVLLRLVSLFSILLEHAVHHAVEQGNVALQLVVGPQVRLVLLGCDRRVLGGASDAGGRGGREERSWRRSWGRGRLWERGGRGGGREGRRGKNLVSDQYCQEHMSRRRRQGASNYVERHLHLRAFSAYRIRTDLDYGEYPLW